jgi:hypothetical protein
MNSFRIYIVFTLVFLISSSGFSQEETKLGEIFVSNNFQDSQEKIYIKWISKHVYFAEGCYVYRKSSNATSWEKINEKPITLRKTPVNGGSSFDNDARNLYDAVNKMSYEEFKSNFIRAFVAIKAIYNNDLAESVGMYFVDDNVSLNTDYTYKIVGIENGKEVELGISKTIKCLSYVKAEAPQDIKIDRKRKRIDITWKPELLRYYGVDVYRKGALDTDFIKITKVPRAIQKIENRAGEITFPKVFFSDLDFDKKVSYQYKFVAIDYFGKQSKESTPITAFVKDFDPPLPVINLRCFPYAKDLNVKLSWEESIATDLYGYNVYRSQKLEGPFLKVNDEIVSYETEYMDILTSPGGYYYYITSVDLSGNEGKSGKVFMDLKDIIPPNAPEGFTSIADTGLIKLSWQPNSEKDLKGYFIQRSLSDDDNTDNKYININADAITETSFTQKMAKNIKNKFVYRVVAIDLSFNFSKPSINSLAQMPDIIAPAIPVIKFIQPLNKMLKIEWLSNTDSDLKGYNVYRKNITKVSTVEKINFALIPKDFKYYEIRNVIFNDKCTYYLTATDDSGNESEKSKGFAFTFKLKSDSIVEEFKVDYKLNVKRKTLKLNWKNLDEIKGCVVFSSGDNITFRPVSPLLVDTENFNVSLDKMVKYYQVRSYKKDGKKVVSNTIEIK